MVAWTITRLYRMFLLFRWVNVKLMVQRLVSSKLDSGLDSKLLNISTSFDHIAYNTCYVSLEN